MEPTLHLLIHNHARRHKLVLLPSNLQAAAPRSAGHPRVNQAGAGTRSCLGERIGERLVCIPRLGFEHAVRTENRMRIVITVRPNRVSTRYREFFQKPSSRFCESRLFGWTGSAE